MQHSVWSDVDIGLETFLLARKLVRDGDDDDEDEDDDDDDDDYHDDDK